MSAEDLDEKSAIVLAGVERLAALQGFPVDDFALVPETDLDLPEIRDRMWNTLAGRHLDVEAGERDGSARAVGTPGASDPTPELGRPANP